ncbi:MAG: tRNA lysidine(34) synthetase TilS [Caulobacter sp.]|nr:tRNA lysidine(34) synthetase TilS [Caulobacter sp.]
MIEAFPSFTTALDRRLRPAAAAPLAVGFSGGGDSLALLILTLAWARAHGRVVVSLTVDHRINPSSAAWTTDAVAKARALGAEARSLVWTGPKPAAGLSAAARAARHALLADAAREAGARVLLLGHTRDDLAEAALMRAEGSTVSDPRAWSPSPAWPEGRGVFVLRPLLEVGRAELRAWLTARGETWLDDPANIDPRSARARARRSLASAESGLPPSAPSVTPTASAYEGGEGWLTLARDAPAAHVAAACLCAAGTTRPPRGERLQRLVARIRTGDDFTATLAGARIEASGEGVSFFREPGEDRRTPSPSSTVPPPVGEVARRAGEGSDLTPAHSPLRRLRRHLPHEGRDLDETGDFELLPNQPLVWDGRWLLTTTEPGLTVRPLRGLAARLPPAQRQALKALPPAARPSLPAVVAADGTVSCPILAEAKTTRARCLVVDRFEAATGRVDQEPAT